MNNKANAYLLRILLFFVLSVKLPAAEAFINILDIEDIVFTQRLNCYVTHLAEREIKLLLLDKKNSNQVEVAAITENEIKKITSKISQLKIDYYTRQKTILVSLLTKPANTSISHDHPANLEHKKRINEQISIIENQIKSLENN